MTAPCRSLARVLPSISNSTRLSVHHSRRLFLNKYIVDRPSTVSLSRSFITPSTRRHAQASSASSPQSSESEPETSTFPDSITELNLNESDPSAVNWSKSFHGLSAEPFPKEAAEVLLAPINPEWIEIKPDGIIYLPEIHYRRILNKAFGPGGWGLAPRGETMVTPKAVTREYALVAHGR